MSHVAYRMAAVGNRFIMAFDGLIFDKMRLDFLNLYQTDNHCFHSHSFIVCNLIESNVQVVSMYVCVVFTWIELLGNNFLT